MTESPEVGRGVVAAGLDTNLHDVGDGPPVLLLHGSGPGVSAWANWRLLLPVLADRHRVIAPDLVGFGYTDPSPDGVYTLDAWVAHAVGVMDEMGVASAHVVGNSFGGAVALRMAIEHPERVDRLVLMGSVGVGFLITEALDEVWGYTPSLDGMKRTLDLFAYDRSLVTDELAELRYRASLRVQDAYAAMFPAPRQRWVDAMATPEPSIAEIEAETLVIHGRDDRVIPLANSLRLLELIPKSQLHVFGQCGHWVQIEHADRFGRLVGDFLS